MKTYLFIADSNVYKELYNSRAQVFILSYCKCTVFFCVRVGFLHVFQFPASSQKQ